jgi:transcriptional regulator with XRE-family HTH domain
MRPDEAWKEQLESLGSFIRAQRQLHNFSLRDLSERTDVSNPYLSQIERGLHEPSVRVLKAIAGALNLSAESLLVHAGMLEDDPADTDQEADIATAAAIRADPELTDEQKQALLAVYQSYRAANQAGASQPQH